MCLGFYPLPSVYKHLLGNFLFDFFFNMFYIFACGIWVRYTVAAIFSGVQVGTASIYLAVWEDPKLLAEKAKKSEVEYIAII